ncbi:hypothetical protein, partial [Enterobacter cloacae complex sp. 6730903]|uniref:hypothetical protein n=1 Tax=Enterobacter cloacae complex sp. 6730903 TaxID=3397164 RepID=UPI003AAB2320
GWSAKHRYWGGAGAASGARPLLDLPPSLISLSIFTSGKAITFPLDVAQKMSGTPGVESLLVQFEQGRIYLKH